MGKSTGRDVNHSTRGTRSCRAIRARTTVRAGGIVEVKSPELVAGDEVDVLVVPAADADPAARRPAADILASLPPEARQFASAADIDRYLNEERDGWDR